MNRGSHKRIRVVVCDDHALFREGVKTILNAQRDMEVVGEAGDGQEAVDLAVRLSPDVVLMDISLPVLKGFDAVRRIRKVRAAVKVLILTVYDDEDLVGRCLEAGAAGYILKDSPPLQLVYAIQRVYQGEPYISPRILTAVVRQYLSHPVKFKEGYDLLSDREREILTLLAEGHTLKDIAGQLNLSVKTVDAHKVNLMRKLDLHDRVELIRYAIRKRIIEA
ncbi:MAG TPA: response regulator transcription factor [Bryobacteraceae bacterium]|nr:response regulator transcription factor [Bryobacteraceae bacterium]